MVKITVTVTREFEGKAIEETISKKLKINQELGEINSEIHNLFMHIRKIGK
jgi:hypothetical protein